MNTFASSALLFDQEVSVRMEANMNKWSSSFRSQADCLYVLRNAMFGRTFAGPYFVVIRILRPMMSDVMLSIGRPMTRWGMQVKLLVSVLGILQIPWMG